MKIGFDLDKVFINTPPFVPEFLIDTLYKNKSHGELMYRIPTKPEQLFRKLTHLPFLRQPIKNNIHALKELSQTPNELYLISSRFSFLKAETDVLVEKYHFKRVFKKMFFNYDNKQPHLFKDTIIRDLSLDVFVDDDLQLIEYVAKKHPHTMFFWYNKRTEYKQIAKNIYAISDLSQLHTVLTNK